MSVRIGSKIISGGSSAATLEEAGIVKPDGQTISISEDGTISAIIPEVDLKDYALKTDVPTKVSDLSNDAGYLTQHQDISGKADKSEVYTKQETDAKFTEFTPDLSGYYTKDETDSFLASKADINSIPDVSGFATVSQLNLKQDALTAGSGILIENGTITASTSALV